MLANSLSDDGGLVTLQFTEHTAKQAGAEAAVMRQHRLHREEIEARKKPGGKKGKKDDHGDA